VKDCETATGHVGRDARTLMKDACRSFLALNHLAAAIMAFRKIKLDVNIICG